MSRNITEIYELDRAIKALEKFCTGGAIRHALPSRDIDKCHAEFNRDNRFSMAGAHTVFYSSNIGYYGNSNCSSQIELPQSCRELFWKCFDRYLNEHQDEILLAICKKMKVALAEDNEVVKQKIEELTALYNELNGEESAKRYERISDK